VRADDLLRLHVPLKKVLPFVLLADHHPGATLDSARLAASLSPPAAQRGLFDDPAPPVAPASAATPRPIAPLPFFNGMPAHPAPGNYGTFAYSARAPAHSATWNAGFEDERHSVWA
jgi:hypothetical protein